MATSQNGWPVNPARTSRTVPGTGVRISVADGPAGDVLMYVAAQFDKRVEDIDNARSGLDDWGWADRPIRGSAETSNHASATAMDLNALQHPLGVAGTFTAAQRAEIEQILAEVGHVVRWGGHYDEPAWGGTRGSRVDEMHFEINASYAAVKRVADRINGAVVGGGAAVGGDEDDDMKLTDTFKTRYGNPLQLRHFFAWVDYRLTEAFRLLKAMAGKLDAVHDELTRQREANGNPNYRRTMGEYTVNADSYGYHANRRLDGIEHKIDRLLAANGQRNAEEAGQ